MKTGSVVRLRSGGPLMTVTDPWGKPKDVRFEAGGDAAPVHCRWFNEASAQFQVDSFREDELELVRAARVPVGKKTKGK